jgi:protein XagA
MRPVAAFGVLLLAAAPAPATGGAFLQQKGRGQAIFTTELGSADKVFNAKGQAVATRPYRKWEQRVYFEYGATDWMTLVASGDAFSFRAAADPLAPLATLIEEAKAGLPLLIRAPQGPHYLGVGLGSLGARVPLWNAEALTVTVEASLRAASPKARSYLDIKPGLQPEAKLQMGAPTQLYGFPAFVDAQIYYRGRGQSGDELRADMTYGLRPLPEILLLFQSFSVIAPRPKGFMSQKFGTSVVYDVTKNVSVQIGVERALGGLNSPAEQGLSGALWLRF